MTKTKPTAYLLDKKRASEFWSENNPSKLRSLTKCHTEGRRGRRIIKTKQWKSRRHRWCTERRSLFANSISNLYTKRLPQNIYQESVCYTSVALCAVGSSCDIAFYLRPLRRSVCLLYKTFCLSPHISEEPKISHIYLEYRG